MIESVLIVKETEKARASVVEDLKEADPEIEVSIAELVKTKVPTLEKEQECNSRLDTQNKK